MRLARIAAALLFWLAPLMAAAGTELLMVEQAGCAYCERWHEEVGPEYPLTEEGKAAPLRPVQLREPLPEGMTLVSKPIFTPTFILLKDGQEVGRIEGYPGEDFFWPLLGDLLKEAGAL